MTPTGATRRALLRHGVDAGGGLAERIGEILDGDTTTRAWKRVNELLEAAGVSHAVAFSIGRLIADDLDGATDREHRILRDEFSELDAVRLVACSCGAEVEFHAKAVSRVAEEPGFRISVFGSFGADACHLAYGIFVKQLMSAHAVEGSPK